jgi:hypothetical protein
LVVINGLLRQLRAQYAAPTYREMKLPTYGGRSSHDERENTNASRIAGTPTVVALRLNYDEQDQPDHQGQPDQQGQLDQHSQLDEEQVV